MGGLLMLSNLFDEYSLNARVRPALLALLSPTIFSYLAFPPLYNIIAGAISIFVVFGLVTTLAHLSRSAGRAAEKKLFSAWGGKPTTIMLRHNDVDIDPITKTRYHAFLSERIDRWVAPTEENELNDPRKADQLYNSAVRWLLEYTRDKKRYPILFKENISYGFRRNCYGIKWLAVILALMPTIVVAVDLHIQNVSIVSVGNLTTWVSICFSVFLFTWWAFVVRAEWVRDAAKAYALRLLAACETDGRT
jgi:hypothetical protein